MGSYSWRRTLAFYLLINVLSIVTSQAPSQNMISSGFCLDMVWSFLAACIPAISPCGLSLPAAIPPRPKTHAAAASRIFLKGCFPARHHILFSDELSGFLILAKPVCPLQLSCAFSRRLAITCIMQLMINPVYIVCGLSYLM